MTVTFDKNTDRWVATNGVITVRGPKRGPVEERFRRAAISLPKHPIAAGTEDRGHEMNGKIVAVGKSIVIRLEDGRLLHHRKTEHEFKVGGDVELPSSGNVVWLQFTNGHSYVTVDYIGTAEETEFNEDSWWPICKPEETS